MRRRHQHTRRARAESTFKIDSDKVFIDHIGEDDLKALTEILKQLGLEFDIKIIYCG